MRVHDIQKISMTAMLIRGPSIVVNKESGICGMPSSLIHVRPSG
jgi:hypothetical protein